MEMAPSEHVHKANTGIAQKPGSFAQGVRSPGYPLPGIYQDITSSVGLLHTHFPKLRTRDKVHFKTHPNEVKCLTVNKFDGELGIAGEPPQSGGPGERVS